MSAISKMYNENQYNAKKQRKEKDLLSVASGKGRVDIGVVWLQDDIVN